jgi:glutamyl-tRNA reductase
VTIIGSGSLAEDLINQFKKKAKISICARNIEKVQELAKLHELIIIPWENRLDLVDAPFIANTVGSSSILFDETFFDQWSKQSARLFVDLGSPSTIRTSQKVEQGVVRLEDIFNEGAIVETQKNAQIAAARAAMVSLTMKRMNLFTEKFSKTLDLLTPQIKADVRYL